MTKKLKWPGEWKFDCLRCGFTFPSSEIKQEWTGLKVCSNCWEPKHPQLMIRVRGESAVPEFTNKDTDQFVEICDIISSSGYAGYGTAGCMKVGNTQFTTQFLDDFYTNGHE